MSEKILTPDTLRALVAHGKGTPAEYIVKRADIDAHAGAWQAQEDVRNALLTILDQVDYTSGVCGPTEMVAAVLPTQVIALARARLAASELPG